MVWVPLRENTIKGQVLLLTILDSYKNYNRKDVKLEFNHASESVAH